MHRSGTTWVGRTVARTADLHYVHEPANVDHHRPSRVAAPHWYVASDTPEEFWDSLSDAVDLRWPLRSWPTRSGFREGRATIRSRRAGRRPLVKDPFLTTAASTVARRLSARVVIVIRHPATVAGSIGRLRWLFDFRALQRRELPEFAFAAARVNAAAHRQHRGGLDAVGPVESAAILWSLVYGSLADEADPSLLLVHYERLAAAPAEEFAGVFRHFDLEYDERSREAISFANRSELGADPGVERRHETARDSVAMSRVAANRLSPADRAHVVDICAPELARFYSSDRTPSPMD